MVIAIFGGVLLALLLILLVLIAPGRLPQDHPSVLWQTNYAHRGLHAADKTVPENSLPAFRAAVEAGYGIELDLNLTTDDEVVVFHDDTLLRMCGVERAVAECSADELSRCRLAGTQEKIPLFRDVLALVGGRVPLVVELKATKRNEELCRRANALLRDYPGPYCIESFHPGIVRWFRRNESRVVRGQLSMCAPRYELPRYQAMLLSGLLTNVIARPHFVAYQHEDAGRSLFFGLYRLMGGRTIAWTVRDESAAQRCRARFEAIIFEFFRPGRST